MNNAVHTNLEPRIVAIGEERSGIISQTVRKEGFEPLYVVYCTDFDEPDSPSSPASQEVFVEGFQNMRRLVNCIEGKASATLRTIVGGYYWNKDTKAIEHPFGTTPQNDGQPTDLFDAGWEPTHPEQKSIDERKYDRSGWTLFVDRVYEEFPHSGKKLQLIEAPRTGRPPQLIALGKERTGIRSQTVRKEAKEALYAVFCSDFNKPENPSSDVAQASFAQAFHNTLAQINFIKGKASETLCAIIGGYYWNKDTKTIEHPFGTTPQKDGQPTYLFDADWEPTHPDEDSIDERNSDSGWTLFVRQAYSAYPESNDAFQIFATPLKLHRVQGHVRWPDGSPAVDAAVSAFDRDMRSEELLGKTQTDLRGFYEIQYHGAQFKRAEKRTADLLIRVYDPADEVVAESDIYFNSGDVTIIDLMIGGGEYLGLSAYERLLSELTPVLQGVPLAELSDEDMHFLFRETGIAVDELEKLRAAAILATETDVLIEIFYAFFQHDLPTELGKLLTLSQNVYREAINAAFADNLIPVPIKESVEDNLARLEQLRANHELEDVPEPGVTPIRDILEPTLDEPEQQEKFMQRYLEHEGPIDTFWSKLRSDPDFQGEGLVDDLQVTLRLGLIAQAHPPMIKYVHQGLSDGTLPGVQSSAGIPQLVDLAQLDQTAWRGLVDQHVDGATIGYPTNTPGDTPAEQAENFAAAMAGTIEAAFPTQVVANRIHRDQPSGADDLEKFFDHNPEFHLNKSGVDVYLAEHPDALDTVQDQAGTAERLRRIQRVYRLTGNYEATVALSENGLSSAKAISATSERDFIVQHADKVDGVAAAKRIHQKAKQTSMLALALYGKYGTAMNATALAAVPQVGLPDHADDDPAPPLRETRASDSTRAVSDWRTWFGTADLALCECAHCGSVYSPAAYLVDSLNLLKPINSGDSKVADILFKRRPDIAELQLSCENTDTTLPYIDLVNEILEGAIAPTYFEVDGTTRGNFLDNQEISEALIEAFKANGYPLSTEASVNVDEDGKKWRISFQGWLYVIEKGNQALKITAVPQTYGSSEDLIAFPQHTNVQAYEKLKQAKYPWDLPFDLWWEEVRLYLAQMGVKREKLMETFQRPVYIGSDQLDPSTLDIACERLGMGPREWELWGVVVGLVSTEESWGVETIYPYGFHRVDELLERSRLSFQELEEFLATNVARKHTESKPYLILPKRCDLHIMVASDGNTEEEMIDKFKNEFESKKKECAVLVVRATSDSDKWTIAGFNDAGVFEKVLIYDTSTDDTSTDDTIYELYKELNKESIYYHRIAELSTLRLDRTLPKDSTWTCDTTQLIVEPSVSKKALGALSRFVRLWRKLGWDMHQLDGAIMVGGDFDISDAVVIHLSRIKQLETKLKLPVDRLLDLWDSDIGDKVMIIAKPLDLTLSEFQSVQALLGIDPFANPAATLGFVKRVRKLQDSPFTIAQLDYIYRHQGKPGDGIVPVKADILSLFTRLQDELAIITAETVMPSQPTLEDLQRKLAVIMEPEEVEKCTEFLLDLPADTPENRAFIELYFPFVDPTEAATALLGHMASDEAARQAYLVQPVAFLLEELLEHLRQSGHESRIKQTLSQALGLDASVTEALLSSILAAETDADATATAMTDYLSLVGEGVSASYFRYDLLLMSVATTDELLDKDCSLVIVALVGSDLHVRIFDAQGEKVVDKAESELVSGATLTTLKQLLNPFPDESSLSQDDKREIIGYATSIAGHTHFKNEDLVVKRIEPIIDFDWGSGTPHPEIAAGNFSAEFKAKLFISTREDYKFFVRTSGGIRLWVSADPIDDPGSDTALIDKWDNDLPEDFESPLFKPDSEGQLYHVILRYKNSAPSAFLRLSWSGPSFDKEVVPRKQLFTQEALRLDEIISSYLRLYKASLLVSTFKLTERELLYLSGHAADFAGFDLRKLPLDASGFSADLFEQWERMRDFVSLRDGLPKGDNDLIDFFTLASTSCDSNLESDTLKDLMAELFGWELADVGELITGFELGACDFKNEIWLMHLKECMAFRKRLGVSPQTLFSWAQSKPDGTQAGGVKDALKSKSDDAQWLQRGRVLSDELRKKRRAALVSYLIANPVPNEGWTATGSNGIYSHFLVDAEMSPCQMTSRVKQAISSVQLFIQRSLMNLEPDVTLSEEHAHQWREWMRNYRVWEANRKVFLYPENYLRPELRDNKTPFFEELESELLQNEISDATAERALLHYLEKLDGVARLQVCGMYHHFDPGVNGKSTVNVLHVFARTYGEPHLYYYCRHVDSAYWTPWEKVELDIEGDHLIPVVYNRRVYLFWPIFRKKAVEATQIPEQDADAKEKIPKTVYEIQFAWSEYRDSRWSAKKISEKTITTVGQSQELRDFVFKAGFDQSQRLAIGCYARRGQ